MKKNGDGGPLDAKLCPRLMTPWTVDWQAPLSLQFPRQEYWSGLPFPSPGDLPGPEIELRSPALQADIYIYIYIFFHTHTHTHIHIYVSGKEIPIKCTSRVNPYVNYGL